MSCTGSCLTGSDTWLPGSPSSSASSTGSILPWAWNRAQRNVAVCASWAGSSLPWLRLRLSFRQSQAVWVAVCEGLYDAQAEQNTDTQILTGHSTTTLMEMLLSRHKSENAFSTVALQTRHWQFCWQWGVCSRCWVLLKVNTEQFHVTLFSPKVVVGSCSTWTHCHCSWGVNCQQLKLTIKTVEEEVSTLRFFQHSCVWRAGFQKSRDPFQKYKQCDFQNTETPHFFEKSTKTTDYFQTI